MVARKPLGDGGCRWERERGSVRRAFLKPPSYPWHTNNGCEIKGPPGSRIRLPHTQCRHIWFTSLPRVSRFFSTSAAQDIKHGMGSIFVYFKILPRSFIPRENDYVDFGMVLSLFFFLFSLFLSIFSSLHRILQFFPFPSYFPRLETKRHSWMNKEQRCV